MKWADFTAARFLIRKLDSRGWLEKQRGDDFNEYITVPGYSSRLLKKAVSFRPIVDIQKFITENICDIPDKPDIEAMQQNIRDYKRHEQLAQRQEEKLEKLVEISRLYGPGTDGRGREACSPCLSSRSTDR